MEVLDALARVALAFGAMFLFLVLRHGAGWSILGAAGASLGLIAAFYLAAILYGIIDMALHPEKRPK